MVYVQSQKHFSSQPWKVIIYTKICLITKPWKCVSTNTLNAKQKKKKIYNSIPLPWCILRFVGKSKSSGNKKNQQKKACKICHTHTLITLSHTRTHKCRPIVQNGNKYVAIYRRDIEIVVRVSVYELQWRKYAMDGVFP